VEEKWQKSCLDELEALLESSLVSMKPGQWEEIHRELAAQGRLRVPLEPAWRLDWVDPTEMVQHFPSELE